MEAVTPQEANNGLTSKKPRTLGELAKRLPSFVIPGAGWQGWRPSILDVCESCPHTFKDHNIGCWKCSDEHEFMVRVVPVAALEASTGTAALAADAGLAKRLEELIAHKWWFPHGHPEKSSVLVSDLKASLEASTQTQEGVRLAELKADIIKVHDSWIGLWQTGEFKQTIVKFPKPVVEIHCEKMDALREKVALLDKKATEGGK